mgnify:CR=1 FL=1
MTSRTSLCIAVITLFAALAIRVRVVAQGRTARHSNDTDCQPRRSSGRPNGFTQQDNRLVSRTLRRIGIRGHHGSHVRALGLRCRPPV